MKILKHKGLGKIIGETKIEGKTIYSYQKYAVLVTDGEKFNVLIPNHPMDAKNGFYLFTKNVKEDMAQAAYKLISLSIF